MKAVKAELISIGDELLAGYTINTNAAWISKQLRDIGIAVSWVKQMIGQMAVGWTEKMALMRVG